MHTHWSQVFKGAGHSWIGTSSPVGRGLRWSKASVPAAWGEVALICTPGMKWHGAGPLWQELCWQYAKLASCCVRLSASASCWATERWEMETAWGQVKGDKKKKKIKGHNMMRIEKYLKREMHSLLSVSRLSKQEKLLIIILNTDDYWQDIFGPCDESIEPCFPVIQNKKGCDSEG